MNYLLVVTTHGESDTLLPTLDSFAEHVSPAPADRVLIEDGPIAPVEWWTGRRISLGRQRGFCSAVAAGWDEARATPHKWVFWLEHDFVFTQQVDLRALAQILSKDQQLAQMALMRQLINERERASGELIPGPCDFYLDPETGDQWTEHTSFFTTNPSLFPAELARENEFPAGPECEGHFGLGLVERGYSFGMWGHNEQFVEHIGTRTGKGY